MGGNPEVVLEGQYDLSPGGRTSDVAPDGCFSQSGLAECVSWD